MLDGHLDDEFVLFSSARYVDFSENMLVSSNSQQQKSLPKVSESIKYLILSHNRLTGSLVSGSEQLGFEFLKVLDLSYNQLSGELPEFDFVYELQVLKLGNNRFSGFVPSGLLKGDSLVLTELDLSGNNLSEPVSIITSATLHFRNLSSNGFTDRPGQEGPPLTWTMRLKIAVYVAHGLNYLHLDRAVPLGNLKATNVLLDTRDLHARIADYCLHKLTTQAGTSEQMLEAGVCAPELAASDKPMPSFKSDVYTFGVILLELLTGRCAGDVVSGEKEGVDLTNWVRLRVAQGRGSECFDAALVQEMGNSVVEEGLNEVLGIAIRCISSVSERPGIKTVYEDLSSI